MKGEEITSFTFGEISRKTARECDTGLFFFTMGNVTQTKLDLGVVCGCGATPKVKRQLKAHTRKSDFALSLQVYLSNK